MYLLGLFCIFVGYLGTGTTLSAVQRIALLRHLSAHRSHLLSMSEQQI